MTLKSRYLLDYCVVFSLVCLSFLPIWRVQIFAEPSDLYYLPDFGFGNYLATLINVIWISSILWLAAVVTRRINQQWLHVTARLCFLGLLLFPLNYVRTLFSLNDAMAISWINDHFSIFIALALIFIGLSMFLLVRHLRLTCRIVSISLLFFLPFGLGLLAQGSFKAVKSLNKGAQTEVSSAQNESTQTGNRPAQRIVWLLFDELDFRLAFHQRPEEVRLPNFARFQKEALFAFDAAAGPESTRNAVPSYITGRIVESSQPIGPFHLSVTFDDGHTGNWTDFQTFFSQANELGARTAIIGTYHPYCRMFHADLVFCKDYSLRTYAVQKFESIQEEMYRQLIGIMPWSRKSSGVEVHKRIYEQGIRALTDPQYDVVYIHASIPHAPHIYNRKMDQLTSFNFNQNGYIDNLVLADKVFGEFRDSMEQAGLWDNTVVLLTSDHEKRAPVDGVRVRKLPFLIRMPGQTQPVIYEPSFTPMLITKDLLVSVMSGELKNIDSVVEWLDGNR